MCPMRFPWRPCQPCCVVNGNAEFFPFENETLSTSSSLFKFLHTQHIQDSNSNLIFIIYIYTHDSSTKEIQRTCPTAGCKDMTLCQSAWILWSHCCGASSRRAGGLLVSPATMPENIGRVADTCASKHALAPFPTQNLLKQQACLFWLPWCVTLAQASHSCLLDRWSAPFGLVAPQLREVEVQGGREKGGSVCLYIRHTVNSLVPEEQ